MDCQKTHNGNHRCTHAHVAPVDCMNNAQTGCKGQRRQPDDQLPAVHSEESAQSQQCCNARDCIPDPDNPSRFPVCLTLRWPPCPKPSFTDKTCPGKHPRVVSYRLETQLVCKCIQGDLVGLRVIEFLCVFGCPPIMESILIPFARWTRLPMLVKNRIVCQKQRVTSVRGRPNTLPKLRVVPHPPRE